MDFHKYSFYKLTFMLNITSKIENEMYLWVNWNLSRHATWLQRSYQIALKQGNQNPQNYMIASFSFTLTAHVTPMVKLSNSTGWLYSSWKLLSWVNSFYGIMGQYHITWKNTGNKPNQHFCRPLFVFHCLCMKLLEFEHPCLVIANCPVIWLHLTVCHNTIVHSRHEI